MDKGKHNSAASFLWWQDSHNRPPQSPWLQATLSDLDEKTKVMVSILDEDDGDSFGRRAETYYRRRGELVDTIQELHKSYRCLAKSYHQQLNCGEPRFETNSHLEPSAEKKVDATDSDEYGSGTRYDLRSRLLKLIGDNLYKQGELMRSNQENREAIQHLCSRLSRLADEDRALKSLLANHSYNNRSDTPFQTNVSRPQLH